MSEGRWRISVTAPDWGQDHLSSEAVVAFVDDELSHGPHERATRHLAQCPECAAQVVAQGQARSALRSADCPRLPSSLLSSLRSIPQDVELPPPPAGLAVTADGQLVSVLRPEPDTRRATMADLPVPDHGRRPPAQRRMRIGTGVAVSGLAIGALAFGVPSLPGTPASPDRGALGGPVLGPPGGVVDARLQLPPAAGPAGRPSAPMDDLEQLRELEGIPWTGVGSFHGLP